MKRLLVLITCGLACCSSAVRAQSTEQLEDGHLRRIEKSIRTALAEIEGELSFEYRKSLPNTLVVNYRTRTFMVHGQSKRGEYTEKVHETVGPSYRGFQLRLTLEEAGFINAAGVPQTSREPYWTTYLDTRLLEGTDQQVFCGLSYGRQVDQELLVHVRKIITDLGDAPNLKVELEAMAGPAPVVGRTPVQNLEWGQDSKSIYTTNQYNGFGNWLLSIRGPSTLDGCILSQLLRLEHHANSMAVGHRTSAVVLGTSVGVVQVRHRNTLHPQKSFDAGKPHGIYAVAIDVHEQQVAACGTDGSVFVWHIDGDTPLHHLQATSREGERMASLAFSPDGTSLAALSRYGRLTLWDLKSGKMIGKPADSIESETSVLQFTPTGDRVVVVGRGTINLWHPIHEPSPRVLLPPAAVCPRYTPEEESRGGSRAPDFGEGIRFAGVATLSRDAKHVASIVESGGVAIWELDSKKVLATLPPPPFATTMEYPGLYFKCIRFSPDGRLVAAATASGEMSVWQLPGR